MDTIHVRLLQTPVIEIGGKQITFYLKKSDALFFYMCIEKNSTRTALANLLWGGLPEETSRKNLRNALYAIKKTIGFDPFETPKKQILRLNSQVVFDIDTDAFLTSRDPSLYHSEFLHGFSLKDSYEFDEWMNLERSRFLDIYLQSLYQQFLQTDPADFEAREGIFHRYIQAEPLDERIYSLMLQTCLENGKYRQGIRCYEELSRQLKQELNLPPAEELNEIYRRIVQKWKNSLKSEKNPKPSSGHLFGRDREFGILRTSLRNLLSGRGSTLFIAGEKGVGKTFLCQDFLEELDRDEVLVLSAYCFRQEQNLPLKAWNQILLQLGPDRDIQHRRLPARHQAAIQMAFPLLQSFRQPQPLPQDSSAAFNYRAVRNSILQLFSALCQEKPTVLFLDDIHYLDSLSAEWLSALIRQDIPGLMILCTCPENPEKEPDSFINQMVCLKNVRKMILPRFRREDVKLYLSSRFPGTVFPDAQLDRIYTQSQGNPFFLELILKNVLSDDAENPFTARAQDILQAQLSSLSREERQLLDLISLFHDYATLRLLEAVTGQESFHLLDRLETLESQEFIVEQAGSDEQHSVHLSFRHRIMQDFVLEQLSPAKARVYHSRIAGYLESLDPPHDLRWYSQLIDHYQKSGTPAKSLYFRILRAEVTSSLNYDLYPVLRSTLGEAGKDGFEERLAGLTDLENELSRCYQLYPGQIAYEEAWARLSLTIGRVCVIQGAYHEGLPRLKQTMTNNSYVNSHPAMRREYARQLVYYGIQTWQLSVMKEALEQCLAIDEQLPDLSEKAIDHRLMGLYHFMSGDFEAAESFLNQAIEEFHHSPLAIQAYSVSLAACYNYLGEIRREQKRFPEAISLYHKAIQICRERNGPENPTFYVNLARALLATGHPRDARSAIDSARNLYETSDTCMGRCLCLLLSSLLSLRDGKDSLACEELLQAEEAARKLGSPFDEAACHVTAAWCLNRSPEAFRRLPETDSLARQKKAEEIFASLHRSFEII